MRGLIKNKRANWINIVEAFISILLIAGVFLVVVNKGYIGKKNISGQVDEFETAVLKEIQLDDVLRTEILEVLPDSDTPDTLKIGKLLSDINAPGTIEKINERIPAYLLCAEKVCLLENVCELTEAEKTSNSVGAKDIYANSISITTGAGDISYYPRQLKLFCWAK
jgi:hypothetical protein